ncbi:hypothetical protein B9Q12_01715 [Candidatus Marsarchaeota G2 archaeon ECH_B_SAG-G06]|uniref:DUF8196 domain-containing protein n=1 Tax=Candidatus Marsarchaeota G2 archaeon ECH_B_SAG-G06 TaxID=1978166 RepID=A0A2R6C1V3_9ARCH|nr:MAG: hypothetical protein B9Q12_01715 [Candidatus Marsarchaeota G2 archaeon ECH_B_SAG-G06]
MHVPLPQPAEVLGLCYNPTAHAQPDHSNPEIHINLSILKPLTTAIKDIGTTLERLTPSLEDEAAEVVAFQVQSKLGVSLHFTRIFVDSREVDLYASAGDLWVAVEAATRLGVKLVTEVDEKVDLISQHRPDLVGKRLIKAAYTVVPLQDAVEEAKNKGVWVLTWREELTPLVIHSTGPSSHNP